MAGSTITLKNVPPELHRSLKESARRHKRSLNQEAIHILESALDSGATTRLLDRTPARSVGKIRLPVEELNARATDMLDHRE